MSSILITKENIDLKPNSRVREVTIYTDRAEVKRFITYKLAAGENTITFGNLGNDIEEDSIKATLKVALEAKLIAPQDKPGARITATFLEQHHLYFFREAEHEQLYHDIIASLKESARLLDEKSLYALENRLINELREYLKMILNPILLKQDISIVKLNEALQFLDELATNNYSQIIERSEQYRRLTEKLDLLRDRLTRVRELDTRLQNNILVTVTADASIEVEVGVSYTLLSATWKTAYDAELDREQSVVRFSYYGEIRQHSGEDWQDVKLFLSTAAAARSMDLPQLYPVYLSGFRRKRDKTVIREDRVIKEAIDDLQPEPEEHPEPSGAGPSDDAQLPSEGAPSDSSTCEPVDFMTKAASTGTAYTFEILRPATIPPDGHWHKVLIMYKELEAEASYETVPELLEYVYLRAALINTLGLPFLPGRVAIYRNKSYIGRSVIKYVAEGGPFTLSFGIDNDLRVKRILYNQTHKPATLLNNKNSYKKEIRFILYNYKSNPEKVLLKEGIFVSEIKDITIDILEETSPGYKLDKEGVVQWMVELQPDPFQHKEIKFSYNLSAPKSFDLARL
jgi:uncharacterized protein (TIGR02231 family)